MSVFGTKQKPISSNETNGKNSDEGNNSGSRIAREKIHFIFSVVLFFFFLLFLLSNFNRKTACACTVYVVSDGRHIHIPTNDHRHHHRPPSWSWRCEYCEWEGIFQTIFFFLYIISNQQAYRTRYAYGAKQSRNLLELQRNQREWERETTMAWHEVKWWQEKNNK